MNTINVAPDYDDDDEAKSTLDREVYGVRATIIDLGLSRMDANDGQTNQVHWSPFDDCIFEGEGTEK